MVTETETVSSLEITSDEGTDMVTSSASILAAPGVAAGTAVGGVVLVILIMIMVVAVVIVKQKGKRRWKTVASSEGDREYPPSRGELDYTSMHLKCFY